MNSEDKATVLIIAAFVALAIVGIIANAVAEVMK